MKRIAALLLSLSLIASMSVAPAFAAEDGTSKQAPEKTQEAKTSTAQKETTPVASVDGDKKGETSTQTPVDGDKKGETSTQTPADAAQKGEATAETPLDPDQKDEAQTEPVEEDTQTGETPAEPTADPAAGTFSDVQGHWAQATMLKAVGDGLIKGYEDKTLRPNAPISMKEMMTILSRAVEGIQVSTIGAEATRGAAFVRLDETLSLSKGRPLADLGKYKDAAQLSEAERRAVSALISSGALTGFPDNTLRPQASISRAEFLTLLYRVLPQANSADQITTTPTGPITLSGPVALSALTFTEPVYFDRSVEEASLTQVVAARAVFTDALTKLTLDKGTKIQTLVMPVAAAKNLSLSDDCRIDTLVLIGSNATLSLPGNIGAVELGGSGNSLTLGASTTRVQVSGAGQSLTVNSALDMLTLDGMMTKLSFGTNGSVKNLTLTKQSSKHELTLPGNLQTLDLDGNANLLTVDGVVDTLLLRGTDNEVGGKGSVKDCTLYSKKSGVLLPCSKFTNKSDEGIRDAVVTLSAPSLLAVDSLLTVTAKFTNPEARSAEAVWIVNDTEVKKETVTVSPSEGSSQYLARFTYKKDMNQDFKVRFELRYTTESGEAQVKSASGATWLENHPNSYYDFYSVDKVLKRVTTGYYGNRTTKWAIDNDYDQRTKEVWMNAKGYSSPTRYMVWISIATQHVNIYEGSQGNWKLIKSYLCGTGKKGTDTPVGVYPIGTRTASGWTTSTYHVSPVLRFKQGSGLAFHSRQYDPRGRYIVDPTIGMPASQGCIRMYDEDIHWMYDNIPIYTTVVVY